MTDGYGVLSFDKDGVLVEPTDAEVILNVVFESFQAVGSLLKTLFDRTLTGRKESPWRYYGRREDAERLLDTLDTLGADNE